MSGSVSLVIVPQEQPSSQEVPAGRRFFFDFHHGGMLQYVIVLNTSQNGGKFLAIAYERKAAT
jgi:hypothetical protein